MFGELDLRYELSRARRKARKNEDSLVTEANKILKQDLFADKKILENLSLYRTSFKVLDEEDLDVSSIFSLKEIEKVAVTCRLKFLEGEFYKSEVPYEATAKIDKLNTQHRKEISTYMILAPYNCFAKGGSEEQALLFLKTNYDNYSLVHSWGKALKKNRKLLYLPLRNFETLVTTVVIVTLIIALALPTYLITLDRKATYWSGYRAAAFFHLLIFNSGVTAYLTFAFAKNFSSTVWNRYTNF